MKAQKSVTRTLFLFETILFIIVAPALGLATEQTNQELVVDKTVLTIDCENAPDSLSFQALLYGSSFENCELIMSSDEFPYTLNITHGNFMGTV